MISMGPHTSAKLSDGQVIYEAFKTEMPVPVNIRRFDTIQFKLPLGEMSWTPCAPVVIEASRTNAKVHLASEHWQGVNALDGAHRGETMVICGSGYSILNVAHKIERKSGVVVVAINGALKALPAGVVDYYFTLDWKGDTSWWSEIDWEAHQPGIKAILGLPTPSDLIAKFSRRYYFPANYVIAEPEKAEQFADKHGFLAESMLATHSAMHLAYRMGMTKVILLGHDFAGTMLHHHWNERLKNEHAGSQPWLMTNDIHGYLTPTSNNLIANANVVSATAKMMGELGIPVINSSEDGILGLLLSMPLDQALAYEPVPVFP